jgi:hypothetical protein
MVQEVKVLGWFSDSRRIFLKNIFGRAVMAGHAPRGRGG